MKHWETVSQRLLGTCKNKGNGQHGGQLKETNQPRNRKNLFSLGFYGLALAIERLLHCFSLKLVFHCFSLKPSELNMGAMWLRNFMVKDKWRITEKKKPKSYKQAAKGLASVHSSPQEVKSLKEWIKKFEPRSFFLTKFPFKHVFDEPKCTFIIQNCREIEWKNEKSQDYWLNAFCTWNFIIIY